MIISQPQPKKMILVHAQKSVFPWAPLAITYTPNAVNAMQNKICFAFFHNE